MYIYLPHIRTYIYERVFILYFVGIAMVFTFEVASTATVLMVQ